MGKCCAGAGAAFLRAGGRVEKGERSAARLLPHRRSGAERARGRGAGGRRPGDAAAGQQVPQLRRGREGLRAGVCLCVCVCGLSPPPRRPARKGVGEVLAHSRLKPRGPAVAACSRGEGGCRGPRCAAEGGGQRGGGRRWRPRGAGRAGLRQPAAAARGGLAAVAPSLAVARLDGRFPRLPRAPGSLASQGRAFPPPASHCSKFASGWAAELVAVAELGGPRMCGCVYGRSGGARRKVAANRAVRNSSRLAALASG